MPLEGTTKDRYPHMCRDGHPQIGHSTDYCPLCEARSGTLTASKVQSKVRRNGHMFWVSNCRELEPGVFVGAVANEGVPFHPFESQIAFVKSEVVDVSVDGPEHVRPCGRQAELS